MKHSITSKIIAASVALVLPVAALAQATGNTTGGTGPSGTGTTGTVSPGTGSSGIETRGTGTSGAATTGAGLSGRGIADADTLFRSLDTNGDGTLSRAEFAKIAATGAGVVTPGTSGTVRPAPTTTGGNTEAGAATSGTGAPPR